MVFGCTNYLLAKLSLNCIEFNIMLTLCIYIENKGSPTSNTEVTLNKEPQQGGNTNLFLPGQDIDVPGESQLLEFLVIFDFPENFSIELSHQYQYKNILVFVLDLKC